MRTPLPQISGLPDGTKLQEISGRVVEIKKYYSGSNSRGPYSFQTLVLEGEGVRVNVKLKGFPEVFTDKQGALFTAGSTTSQKGKIQGIEIVDDEYNGKTTRLVSIAQSTAVVTYGENAGQPAKAAPPSQTSQAPQQTSFAPTHAAVVPRQPSAPAPARSKSEDQMAAVNTTKQSVGQIINCWLLCAKGVKDLAMTRYTQIFNQPMSDTQLQGLITTVFIETVKRGGVAGLPSMPIMPDPAASAPPTPPVSPQPQEPDPGPFSPDDDVPF